MDQTIYKAYRENHIFPIIGSLRYLEEALQNPGVMVLTMGDVLNVLNVRRVVQQVKEAGRKAIVDLDLVSGLSNEEAAVHFLVREAGVDGIITRQRGAVITAKKQHVWAVFKVFVQDKISIETAISNIESCRPDSLDLLPGIAAPFALSQLRKTTDVPFGISGFIEEDEEAIRQILRSGVDAIHTRNRELWGKKFD